MRRTNKSEKNRAAGFSIMELLIVLLILGIVLGIATNGLMQLQKRSTADASKLDKTQEARQFMDQIINDIHQTGYPGTRIFDPAGAPSPNNIANGLVSITSNSIQFEADVDGSGTVSEVYLQLVIPAAGCPCILQRGTIPKAQVGTGAIPYYTEVNNVMNQNVFQAYHYDGTTITLPVDQTTYTMSNIKTIKMTVNVQASQPEADGSYPTITMASEAKINN